MWDILENPPIVFHCFSKQLIAATPFSSCCYQVGECYDKNPIFNPFFGGFNEFQIPPNLATLFYKSSSTTSDFLEKNPDILNPRKRWSKSASRNLQWDIDWNRIFNHFFGGFNKFQISWNLATLFYKSSSTTSDFLEKNPDILNPRKRWSKSSKSANRNAFSTIFLEALINFKFHETWQRCSASPRQQPPIFPPKIPTF